MIILRLKITFELEEEEEEVGILVFLVEELEAMA
jgi:hypothetical protein